MISKQINRYYLLSLIRPPDAQEPASIRIDMTRNAFPFEMASNNYPLVVLIDDPKLANDNMGSSLFTFYNYIESISLASLNESVSPNYKQVKCSQLIQNKYSHINWPLGYSIVDQPSCMATHLTTDAIDKILINSVNLENDLKKGLFLIDTSSELYMSLYPKKLCRINEEMRQMICLLREKFKNRRKEIVVQRGVTRVGGTSMIAIIGFQQTQLYAYEKCEII